MTGGTTGLLALNIIALGILGVILSFLVTDRKKSLLSLVLALVVVVTGGVQYGQFMTKRFQWNKKMKKVRQDREVNLEELRKKLKDQANETKASVEKAAN